MEYNGINVITTKQLATFFNTNVTRIYTIFNRYNEKFEEGKDYFLLSKKDIEEWSKSVHLPGLKHTSLLYLWTDQGAFKIAQSFKGLKAWQGYCNCIHYFYGSEEDWQTVLNDLFEKMARKVAEK